MMTTHVCDEPFVDSYGVRMVVHREADCLVTPCTIHSPSEHHMRGWPLLWRGDRRIFERTCPHGVGHPDPDDIFDEGVHGCDGCCRPNPDDRNTP